MNGWTIALMALGAFLLIPSLLFLGWMVMWIRRAK
jgi:hypothetical protein